MFQTVSPESAGVSSKSIEGFIKYLNENKLATHSIMMLRGGKVFCRAFWKPYCEDSLHRMYSETKSFVGLAVCQLISEGKIGLSDRITDYFKDKLPESVPEELKKQTVEDMLTMKTCMSGNYWFDKGVTDRVKYYFSCKPAKNAGESYYYDSDGSFVLGALVERVTGKRLLDYLREVCLDEIGFSPDAIMLSCPGGYSWGDSGLICKTEDICRFALLLASGGKWRGTQLLNPEAVKSAISRHSDTSGEKYPYEKSGYGYQIWMNPAGGFSFQGMHGQYMHYDPVTGIIFACTSGNRSGIAGHLIFEGLERFILSTAKSSLPEDPESLAALNKTVNGLSLPGTGGKPAVSAEKDINGRKYILSDNPMKIKYVRFCFYSDRISLSYENEQGEKQIIFGRNENRLQEFPQTGYSDDTGGISSPLNTYRCAACAAWETENTLSAKVQIIDKYIGILDMKFEFSKNRIRVIMDKEAENFLDEYSGEARGKAD